MYVAFREGAYYTKLIFPHLIFQLTPSRKAIIISICLIVIKWSDPSYSMYKYYLSIALLFSQ